MKTALHAILFLFIALQAQAQVSGCTDPLSANYNPNATVNDGSCQYATSSVPALTSVQMAEAVQESSGLIIWNDAVYTHNDDTDNHIYRISPDNGEVTQTLTVAGAVNQDWEEISQDEDYIYIGDFGNNVNGNRTNLHIIRVAKEGLLAGNPVPENISFSYNNQSSLAATGNNNTDFDCEAMVVGTDYIYLFTKQWVSKKTSLYRLPKTPGNYSAELITTFNVNGLITGATWLPEQRIAALCGYSSMLSPFIYLLYDFEGDDFFGGNKRKISFTEPFTQVEGIATANGTDYYLSCEHFQQTILINNPQQLFSVNLESYLGSYLAANPVEAPSADDILMFPNPTDHTVRFVVKPGYINRNYSFVSATGQTVLSGVFMAEENVVDVSALAAGIYIVNVARFSNPLKLIIE